MMKHIKILFFLLLLGYGSQAQFITTDSIKTYIDKYIGNNATTAFQNKRLNTALKGLASLLDSVDAKVVGGVRTVDSLWKYNDSTLAFRIKGQTYTLSGLGGSGSGSFSGISHDNTFIGIGTPLNPLKQDTVNKIATKTDLRRLQDSVAFIKDTLKVTGSITALVTPTDTLLQLVGDVPTLAAYQYYGSGATGVKTFYPLPVSNLSVIPNADSVYIYNSWGAGVKLPYADNTHSGVIRPIDYFNLINKVGRSELQDTAAAIRAAVTSGGGGGGGPETDPTYLSQKPTLVQNTLTYSNPSWLTDFSLAKITGKDTLLFSTLSYSNPSWLTALDNSKITGLSALLAGKSDVTHNHSLDALVNMNMTGKTTGDLIMWNGTAWVKKTPDWMTAAAGDLRWAQVSHSTDAATILSGTIPAGRYGVGTVPTNAINAPNFAAGKVLGSAGWVDPSGVTDGDKGDITVSGGGSAFTVDAASITPAKLAVQATQTFIGRNSAGTNTPEILTVPTVRTMLSINNVDNTTDANKPVSTATAAALAGKQATLVSGTNIRTVNGQSLLGSTDIVVQPTLVSGTNIKTINGSSILGSGNVTVSGATALKVDKKEFIQASNSATYQDSALIYKTVLSLSVSDYPVSLIERTGSVYASFDRTTGTITLSNGYFASNDFVRIIYRDTLSTDIAGGGTGGGTLSGFGYRRALTVDNTGSNTNQSGTQIAINLTSSNFSFAKAKTDGSDIRFTASDGSTPLNYWIESYNSGAQTGKVWVKLPALPTASTGTIYMYYGNAGASTTSSFASTMQRYWPGLNNTNSYTFSEGSGTVATNLGIASGQNGTISGTSTWLTSDLFGGTQGSLKLNGTSTVKIPNAMNTVPASGAIHMIVKFQSFTAPGKTIFWKKYRSGTGAGGDYGDFIRMGVRGTGNLYLDAFIGTTYNTIEGVGNLTTGTTYHITVTWNQKWVIIWVNGAIYYKNRFATPFFPTTMGAGSNDFIIGGSMATADATVTSELDATIQHFSIYTKQKLGNEIEIMHQNLLYAERDEYSKWTKNTEQILFKETSPAYSIEPQPIFEDGVYKLYFTTVLADGLQQIGVRQSATVAGLATASTTVVAGNGVGGQTDKAGNFSISKFGSTYYLYFVDGGGVGKPIACVTSTDGVTFGNKTTVLSLPGSGWGSDGFFNTSVVFHNGLYYMIAEGRGGVGNPAYSLGVATSSTPNGTFTLISSPNSGLQYGAGTVYTAPDIHYLNGRWEIWTCNGNTGHLPAEIYRSYTSDFVTFSHPAGYVSTKGIVRIDEPDASDQVGDQNTVDNGVVSHMFYNAVQNDATPFQASINYVTFNGTLAQVVKDLTITIQSEQAL